MLDKITKHIVEQDEILKDNPSVEKYIKELQEGLLPQVTADHAGGRLILTLGKEAQTAVAAGAGIAAAVVVISLLGAARRLYKDVFHKYGRKCSDFKHGSAGRKKCETMARVKALETKMKALLDSKKYCNKSKNPSLCSGKIDAQVRKLVPKLQKYKQKFSELKD